MSEQHIYEYGTQITDFSNIFLAKENERINNIQDIRAETYDRQKSFQKSENKKKNAWKWVYVVLLLVAILVVVIVLFRKQYPDMWYLDLLLIFVIGGTIIYLIVLYFNIENRSPLDFDKIDPNSFIVTKMYDTVKQKYGVNETVQKLCVGDLCCSGGLVYDNALDKCVVNSVEEFVGTRLQDNFYTSIYTTTDLGTPYE
jgi:membrane-associated HD superfamily phosphohydrolase